jgi:IS5 family transposase
VKIELVVDRTGVPVGLATDAASVPETVLVLPAVADIPAAVLTPTDTPLVADRAYDSDPRRDELAGRGFRLLAPHRRNRKRPSRNDGRRMRRFRRRWVVERTFAWLHCYRRVVTRYDRMDMPRPPYDDVKP